MSETLAVLRRRRGVARGSITRIKTKVRGLRDKEDKSDVPNHARMLIRQLESLITEYKDLHYSIVEQLTSDEDLDREQVVLDEADDYVSDLQVALEMLLASCAEPRDANTEDFRILSRRLAHHKSKLDTISRTIRGEERVDIHLLQQYESDITNHKKDLAEMRTQILILDLDDRDEICVTQSSLEDLTFQLSLELRRLMATAMHQDSERSMDPGNSLYGGVKLPKLEVAKFNGNIIHWRTFWEQFNISVHSRTNISDAEKLVYLKQALKEGSAKEVIEGLSRTGECYGEAVECLKERFDRPRLIHQAHVERIMDAPALKEGTGRELRRLHDTVQQNVRALKAMELEPSGEFVTSLLELKLDTSTMFEWQKYSQDTVTVPHYSKLLEFLNLRAQASETTLSDQGRKTPRDDLNQWSRNGPVSKRITSYSGNAVPKDKTFNNNCVLCKTNKHPLYGCTKFQDLSQSSKMSVLKSNGLCINCLRPGHFVSQCKSIHRCRTCQRPHHSLLHVESENPTPNNPIVDSVTSHTATELNSNTLLMTLKVLIEAPDGKMIEARGILDSASSASFVSERIVQSLGMPRYSCKATISGIAGLSHPSKSLSTTSFNISPLHFPDQGINVTAVIVPRVTCNLPVSSVPFNPEWNHIANLKLADPTFGSPGKIDILLGVDIFASVLQQGRRFGSPGTPTAFKTKFGWVLAGQTELPRIPHDIVAHHVTMVSCDDMLHKFWEIESIENPNAILTPEEKAVQRHYEEKHYRTESGAFVVPLPKKESSKQLGESRSKAVRRFISLEKTLRTKEQREEFHSVMEEYFDLDHAETVPQLELDKAPDQVFYLPMHAVRKEASTTTKLRIVFDASAKTTNDISLNDMLLVGPTVHPPLVDILLHFRTHRIALTADVSKMYRAIRLIDSDKDLHRFVWRKDPDEPLMDYRMTRVTFGVSASSYAANMSLKQNAIDYQQQHPLASAAVNKSFYVDDGLMGADSVEDAIILQRQLQALFSKGGFLLRKWNSNEPTVLQHLPPELKDSQPSHMMPDTTEYTKTLGIEWNPVSDHFRLVTSELHPVGSLTKRSLVSDIAKTFDVLGWFTPVVIKVKILLQRLWEEKVDWDETVPSHILDEWLRWRAEIKLLSDKHIPRCYFPRDCHVADTQIHGFCDASENAYAAVVYFRLTDTQERVHVPIVIAKSRVSPIKRQTIPRLELCGAQLLAHIMLHVKKLFDLPTNAVYAWTDSTIVLNWLNGNPRRFKTFVGNRISDIMDCIPPNR